MFLLDLSYDSVFALSVPIPLFIYDVWMCVLTDCLHSVIMIVQEFHLLSYIFVYLEHNIKRILALSMDWKVNSKLTYNSLDFKRLFLQ